MLARWSTRARWIEIAQAMPDGAESNHVARLFNGWISLDSAHAFVGVQACPDVHAPDAAPDLNDSWGAGSDLDISRPRLDVQLGRAADSERSIERSLGPHTLGIE